MSEGKVSQATTIIQLARDSGVELFHTPTGEPYITIAPNGFAHKEHHRLGSRASRTYLAHLYYVATGTAPSSQGLQDAIGTLSGIALFSGDEHDVHVRLAGDDTRIYLDLGDATWRVVEMTSDGWKIVSNAPVRFRRPRFMMPLPVPVHGGSLTELRPFVNIADDDFPLVCSWEIAALRPTGPYPVLDFIAEQGSGKSTTACVLRRLIDPHASELRRPPRNTEDLMVAAANSYVITIDNISHLPDWLSDDLAVLSTGGGLSKRELYSDAEECVLKAQRPIVLTGISHAITRPDLLDRAIVLTLPMIPDAKRQPEAVFWGAFTEAHPRILGALLDAVVVALKTHKTIKLAALPRMADFAIWAVAAESACPWEQGTFFSDTSGIVKVPSKARSKEIPLRTWFGQSLRGPAPRRSCSRSSP